jgi:hypothetical protein
MPQQTDPARHAAKSHDTQALAEDRPLCGAAPSRYELDARSSFATATNMNLTNAWIIASAGLTAAGLATWSWLAVAQLADELRSFGGVVNPGA